MFLLDCFPAQAQHVLINQALSLPGGGGLNISLAHFDGYSPVLDGALRTVVESPIDSIDNIKVMINVKAPRPSFKNNIQFYREKNNISIATGGLSLVSYLTAPRLVIDIVIYIPRNRDIGNLTIKSGSLPIFISTISGANDVVLHSESSAISVEEIDARSLTVSSSSGAITFEPFSKQKIERFTKVTNSSGSTSLRSSLSSPFVSAQTNSSSLAFSLVTTAKELLVKNSSGSISGKIEYSEGTSSRSLFRNSSGSTNLTFDGWSGFLTAESSSGSKNVTGNGLEKWNNGWRKGSGESTAAFASRSGSIKVEIL